MPVADAPQATITVVDAPPRASTVVEAPVVTSAISDPTAPLSVAEAPVRSASAIPQEWVPNYPFIRAMDFTGTGVLTVEAGTALARTAALTGAGVLTATTLPVAVTAAALTGAGVLTVDAYPWAGTFEADADLIGAGALTAAAVVVYPVALPLTGAGALTATVAMATTAAADLTGTGSLAVTAVPVVVTVAGFTGTGTLSAALLTDAEFTGIGALTVNAFPVAVATMAITGTGVLTASASVAVHAAAALTGTGVLSAGSAVTLTIGAALTGTGALTATAEPTAIATAALAGTGTLTAVSEVIPYAPIRVASNGAVFDASPSAPTSFTANYPSGSASGDLLVMQAHISKSAAAAVALTPASLTGGAQWNFIQQRDDSATNGVYMAYFWTIRGSETSVTITPSPTTSIRSIIATIAAYEAGTVDAGMPIGEYSNGYLLTNNTTGIAAPAVTTVLANTEVLLFSTSSNATDTALTTTWTNADAEILDAREWVSAQTSNYQHSAAYDVRASAGVTTTYTATPSATSAGKVAAAHVIQPVITTYPKPGAYLTDFADANGTSTDIAMPTAATGDLLLVEFQADGSQTTIATSSSGWTKIGQYANSTVSTFALFAGISGTAAALTITNTTSLHRAWTVRVIKNWSGVIADIEVASTTGSSTNMNPPSLSPSHGSQPYLWGAIGVGSQNSTYPTLPPAGWGNFVNVRCNASAGSTHIGHGDGWTLSTGTAMDPPVFTSATGAWLALTVAII